MSIIYVAGPYRHETICGTLDNIRFAERIAKILWRNGFVAVCPHTNSRLFDDVAPQDVFLNGYERLVTRCDGMVLVPGWEKSSGTRREKAIAENCGIYVVEFPLYLTVTQSDDGSLKRFMEELHAKC